MRFFVTDSKPVTLNEIECALQNIDAHYALRNIEFDEMAALYHGDTLLANIEINLPEDDIFQDDIAEFLDLVGEGDTPTENLIRDVLKTTQIMVVVEAFWEGTDSEPVFAKIDPLWDWLFAQRSGLSQADSEGFYDAEGLILERRFTL